jgi:hypothetical protein
VAAVDRVVFAGLLEGVKAGPLQAVYTDGWFSRDMTCSSSLNDLSNSVRALRACARASVRPHARTSPGDCGRPVPPATGGNGQKRERSETRRA